MSVNREILSKYIPAIYQRDDDGGFLVCDEDIDDLADAVVDIYLETDSESKFFLDQRIREILFENNLKCDNLDGCALLIIASNE